MGRLIDTSNIRVKPQYMQDVMGIAMIRCEDLSRILADVPTVEAIPKADYENRLKADMAAMLTDIQLELDEMKITKVRSAGFAPYSKDPFRRGVNCSKEIIQQKINTLREQNNESD